MYTDRCHHFYHTNCYDSLVRAAGQEADWRSNERPCHAAQYNANSLLCGNQIHSIGIAPHTFRSYSSSQNEAASCVTCCTSWICHIRIHHQASHEQILRRGSVLHSQQMTRSRWNKKNRSSYTKSPAINTTHQQLTPALLYHIREDRCLVHLRRPHSSS
jgi:hypothetical protein